MNAEMNFSKEHNQKNPKSNPKLDDNLITYIEKGYKGLMKKVSQLNNSLLLLMFLILLCTSCLSIKTAK